MDLMYIKSILKTRLQELWTKVYIKFGSFTRIVRKGQFCVDGSNDRKIDDVGGDVPPTSILTSSLQCYHFQEYFNL